MKATADGTLSAILLDTAQLMRRNVVAIAMQEGLAPTEVKAAALAIKTLGMILGETQKAKDHAEARGTGQASEVRQ